MSKSTSNLKVAIAVYAVMGVIGAALILFAPAEDAGAQTPNPCVVAITNTWPASTHKRILAISYRESRHTQTAVNRRSMGARWGRATGCLQILPGVARNIGSTCDLRTAWCNASTGYRLYKKMGWSPWRVR